MADSPVRWGILGTGGIASTFVTDLRLTDSGVAVAVGSRSQGSADRFADEFGIATGTPATSRSWLIRTST